MKATLKFAVSSALIALLSACGGGGGDSSNASSNSTELEGTWTYASAGHATGGTCGLDVHGAREVRVIYKFQASTFQTTLENCVILSGNTGSFVLGNSASGSFTLGAVYMTVGTDNYRAIDVVTNGTTQYSGYALIGNSFKQAGVTPGNDGSTAATRMRGTGVQGAGTFVKQ